MYLFKKIKKLKINNYYIKRKMNPRFNNNSKEMNYSQYPGQNQMNFGNFLQLFY